jgi:rhodanese-related sulfurtransferase
MAGHIPDARHIPVDELVIGVTELRRGRLRETYCNARHPGNSRSERAAALLPERGYRAQALDGGFPAWVAAGYPVDRGLPASAALQL